ncbi:hypothetical protein CNMCM5878_004810 [Aspergillus fumigatiaffinis]|nr:hypothetical protein CNMCM5878_004810 [Aspergillus fumigatiaffinis]
MPYNERNVALVAALVALRTLRALSHQTPEPTTGCYPRDRAPLPSTTNTESARLNSPVTSDTESSMARHEQAAPAQNPADTIESSRTKTREHYIFSPRLLFTYTDLFRTDVRDLLQNLYPAWQQEGFWGIESGMFHAHDFIIQRLVKVTKYVTKLRECERIGQVQLEVGFLLQYVLFDELSKRCSRAVRPADIVMKALYPEDWEAVSLKIKTTRRRKLRKQLDFGRRWSMAVEKLSGGVILLGGRRLSSIIHSGVLLKDLIGLLNHIATQHPETIRIYGMLDESVKCLLTGSKPPVADSMQICGEIEVYLQGLRGLNTPEPQRRSDICGQIRDKGLHLGKRKRLQR